MDTLISNILLIEDETSIVELIKEALNEASCSCQLHVVRSGEEGLDFLQKLGSHRQAPRPQIILLNSNLPKMSGDEFLLVVKQDENFKQIPVTVLTTSDDPSTILKYYSLHANCYILKSTDLEHFFSSIKALIKFWLEIVTLPPQ
ncbi:MAG: response regulator [Cyanophyceae cyanobacterium]